MRNFKKYIKENSEIAKIQPEIELSYSNAILMLGSSIDKVIELSKNKTQTQPDQTKPQPQTQTQPDQTKQQPQNQQEQPKQQETKPQQGQK